MATPERTVLVRPRTVLSVLGITLLVAVVIGILYAAWHVITWILIAVFLALALNPAVEFLVRKGLRRGLAAILVFLLALGAIGGLGFVLIPPLIRQIQEFVDAVPGLLEDLTKGEGPLGFLERDYHIVDRVRDAIEKQGAGGVLGCTAPALSIARSVVTAVVGVVTVAFLTLFMLLDGRRLVESGLDLLPEQSRPRWERALYGVYRTVGGYVTGNLLISLIAGTVTTVVLLATGVPYSVPLGVLVAVFDLVPLAGATIAALLVATIAFITQGVVIGIVIILFFLVYQQVENHLLQPFIYGRTVRLSPVLVLMSVLVGAELAGVLGALGAIPIAGSLQVIVAEALRARRERTPLAPAGAAPGKPPSV